MKKIRYLFEAVLLYLLFFLFRLMPAQAASDLGGWIGRTIGPRLAASRKAYRNLQSAMPALSEVQQKEIITEMWENLGRVMAEYPHLRTLSRDNTVLEHDDILQDLIMQESPAVFFGAHQGNWEVNCAMMHTQFNQPIDVTYRAPNNPWSDKLLMKARTLNGVVRAHPKTKTSARSLIQAIKDKRYIGVLLDQKYNEGMAVPFFGMDAMTNPVFVELCQKYDCPLVPIRNIRTNGANFRLQLYEPLELFDEHGQPRATEDVLVEISALLESWIREYPGQWLWLHRRWDSKSLDA